MNIDEQVLAAFQIEHKEHLLRIRSLLGTLAESPAAERKPNLDEAFRLAHSLKGGARVCDLRPAVALGHGLETVFSRLREGQLTIDANIAREISVVLDGIEDWMAAHSESDSPPEPVAGLGAIERLLNEQPKQESEPVPANNPLVEELRQLFREECRSYVDALREFLQRIARDGIRAEREWDEPIRLAHNLRISAASATARPLETLGRRLEECLRAFQLGEIVVSPAALATLLAMVDIVEQHASDMDVETLSAAGVRAMESTDHLMGRTELPPRENPISHQDAGSSVSVAEPQIETVRVRAESLDRILQSSGRLLTESLHQDQVTKELAELRRQIEQMARDREAVRRTVGVGTHGQVDDPATRQLIKYVESVDLRLQQLSQGVRKVCVLQQRSAWLVRSCGGQIQSDVRLARMVSAESLFQAFPKMVRELGREEGKQIDFKFVGAEVRADRLVLQALKDPIMHMLRNCVIHGVESAEKRVAAGKSATGNVSLSLRTLGNQLEIQIEDDGRGLDLNRIAELDKQRRHDSHSDAKPLSQEELARLIFEPGFSTCTTVTELAGRGMGLSVVYETVKRLQGTVQVLPRDGAGTALLLTVPVSVSTHRLLMVSAGEQVFAAPLHAIDRLLRVKAKELESLEGRRYLVFDNQPVLLIELGAYLGLSSPKPLTGDSECCVLILRVGNRRLALLVDGFLCERDALVQPLDIDVADALFAGIVLMEDGRPVLVLNPAHALANSTEPAELPASTPVQQAVARASRCVLVVDDSFTTRTLEKSILETHGYTVQVAIDGQEALNKLQCSDFDLVITDVEMPRLDGFGLLAEMRKNPRLNEVPVILVTSCDKPEDKKRGLDLGAEAYIIKRKFDHQVLLSTIEQVL